MICPKCGNEMSIGEIGIDSFSKGVPTLFFAKKDFFRKHTWLTRKKAVAEGGMIIPIGNGFYKKRNTTYACRDCNMVLIDLNI